MCSVETSVDFHRTIDTLLINATTVSVCVNAMSMNSAAVFFFYISALMETFLTIYTLPISAATQFTNVITSIDMTTNEVSTNAVSVNIRSRNRYPKFTPHL